MQYYVVHLDVNSQVSYICSKNSYAVYNVLVNTELSTADLCWLFDASTITLISLELLTLLPLLLLVLLVTLLVMWPLLILVLLEPFVLLLLLLFLLPWLVP